jgi:hypothetical protein
MSFRRSLRAVVLFATAAAGLVGGHLLGYSFAEPDARARDALLARTGHSYLSKALIVAAAAAIVAGIGASVLGFVRARRRGEGPLRFGSVALPLVALQVTGFLLLEAGERLLAGVPGADLLSPVILVGLPLQALVAALGALALLAVARTAAAVARVLSSGPSVEEQASSEPLPAHSEPLPPRQHASPRVTRGPPLVRVAYA